MLKKLSKILLTVMLTFTLTTKVQAQNEEYEFDLHATVFDYGEAIDQVIIKTKNKNIDETKLKADLFTIKATATNPYDLGSNASYGLYNDVTRQITKVSLNSEGNIVLDLHCEYNGQGQGTLNYVAGTAARNLSMDIAYDISLNNDIPLTSGAISKNATFTQVDIINEETAQFSEATSNGLNYQYFTPSNANDGNDHPLVIWFHGNGEGGYNDAQNNNSQLRANRGALGFATPEAQAIFGGAYVIAPQAPDTWYNNYSKDYIGKATALIKEFAAANNIDMDRIYVYGCSAGGYMTLRMAIENPDLFAAVVPTCPAIDIAPARGGVETTDEEILSLSDIPMWLIQADDDTTVNPINAAGRVADLLDKAIYTAYPNVTVDNVKYPGHWSWIYTALNMPTHDNVSLMEWTAKQKINSTYIDFDLNAQVYDYGEAINQVIIKTNNLNIDTSKLSIDQFNVLASATNPYDLGSNPAYGLYSDVTRQITKVSLNSEGNIVLDLHCEYNGQGQGTLNYVAGTAARNLSMDIAYDISLNKDIVLKDGSIITDSHTYFKQKNIVNNETAQFSEATSNGLNYQYFTPSNANDGNDHPLVIWFHGNGEGGYNDAQNNNSQLRANRGALGFATPEAQAIFGGAYVIAPQAPDTWYNNYSKDYIGKATALIKEFAAANNIDMDRIYIYGCSAGGYMTLRMAIENPDLFAAVVPTCPAIDIAPARGGVETTDEEILSLSDIPMWLIQADDDTTVNPINAAGRVADLLDKAIYTAYPNVTVDNVKYPGHWSWIYTALNMPTHDNISLMEWTAKQTRAKTIQENVENIPNTGDYSSISLYSIALVSAAVGLYLTNKKRKAA